MIVIYLWVMIVYGGTPSPFVMGTWWDQLGEETCRHNTAVYNDHHHEPLHAKCIKYVPDIEYQLQGG